MAYTINNTAGGIVATVEDGVLDTTTSVSLIGRNYQSYGEAFNENLVQLLENCGMIRLVLHSKFTMVQTLCHWALEILPLSQPQGWCRAHCGTIQPMTNCTCMMVLHLILLDQFIKLAMENQAG